jgi:uncharacterized membrane protein YdbT with pleckstrin-like domain
MPLTNCPDCGREISTAAPACPNCGRPNAPAVAPPQAPVVTAEEKLWHASPSWLLLLGKIIWLAIVAIGLPALLAYANGRWITDLQAVRILWYAIAVVILWRVIIMLFAWARIRSTMYTVTNQRVIIETGIAEKKVEDIDLRYIDETNFSQRILERMLGIGNVMIVSSDKVAPRYVLHGIPAPRELRELIRAKAYEVSQRQLFTRAT